MSDSSSSTAKDLGHFTCAYCGKESPRKHKGQKFCSRTCSGFFTGDQARKRGIFKCAYCGKESQERYKGQKFCDHTCRGASQSRNPNGPDVFACQYCGNESVKKHKTQQFCSKRCANMFRLGTETRNREIIELVESGLTYQAIGERFGISHQRVQQIKDDHYKATGKDPYQFQSRAKVSEFHCEHCGKKFAVKRGNLQRRFCSQHCNASHTAKRKHQETIERDQQIRSLIDSGTPCKDIAEQFGLSIGRVYQIRRGMIHTPQGYVHR